MIPQPILTLKSALQCLSRDDLEDMTIEEIDSLEADLSAWANIAMVTAMTKRAGMRDEAPE